MDKLELLKAAKKLVLQGLDNETLQKAIFGTYTNGKPRSAIDAYNNEILSPKDRLLIEERMERIRKKKKKHKKKKKPNYDWMKED